MINYITNLDVNDYSGGWSGMNHFIHEQFASRTEVNLIQNINPPYRLSDRILSKAFRVAGLNGIFPAFTEARLTSISKSVTSRLDASAKFSFFHGATPWLNVQPKMPYAMYMDACFGTYIRVYHKGQKFSKNQLTSLYKKETSFITNAVAAFFSSQWALEDARNSYQIDTDNLYVAGLGGEIEESAAKAEPSEKYFLFVALDFMGKGGAEVVEAFTQLQSEFKNFRLKIVGQRPPASYLNKVNIDYVGYLDKRKPDEKQKLSNLFRDAYAFVLPTVRDLTPLVLVEAGSAGCPAIATAAFGIPEIVIHQKTGLLISSGVSSKKELLHAMRTLCADSNLHQQMKVNAKKHIRENFTWNKVGERIFKQIPAHI